jgi:hypothetical protein
MLGTVFLLFLFELWTWWQCIEKLEEGKEKASEEAFI